MYICGIINIQIALLMLKILPKYEIVGLKEEKNTINKVKINIIVLALVDLGPYAQPLY